MSLRNTYGELLMVRPPVPATVNKAGANYKSEVAHLTYSPRTAYREWLAICEAICACGGDALFEFEARDEPLLGVGDLAVDGDGAITPAGSSEVLANIADIQTGRVFTANGPWVVIEDRAMRACMMNMLAHRVQEADYYRELLAAIADAAGCELSITDNPHRWEGMADVAVVGDKVVLTYAVPGHYDRDVGEKSGRSVREGVAFAADFAAVPDDARIYAELVYPHFHGDTVHFGARPTHREPVLMFYEGGLYDGFADIVTESLGAGRIVPISEDDAVVQYCGNSRQVRDGVLIPSTASPAYEASLTELGLTSHRVSIEQLFGKAGGGPGCATLYLPSNLDLPADAPMRFSNRRAEARARTDRLADTLTVAPEFFEGKKRG